MIMSFWPSSALEIRADSLNHNMQARSVTYHFEMALGNPLANLFFLPAHKAARTNATLLTNSG